MDFAGEDLFSPRIRKHCLPLWQGGHYKQAAHEAMIQVEVALKEKGLVQQKHGKFGHTLISSLLKPGGKVKSVKLRVPLGEELQDQAEAYFQGVFSYYRNYTAHDGSKIDKQVSVRVMILASELLDLIDASSLSFADIGGVEGLLEAGPFSSQQDLRNLLLSLIGQFYPDGDVEGLMDDLFDKFGLTEMHVSAAIDLDLVRYIETEYSPSREELRDAWHDFPPPQTLGHFELTELGEETIEEIQRKTGR